MISKQRGGGFSVNGYLALALVAVAVLSSVHSCYQHRHPAIEIVLPTTLVTAPKPGSDADVGRVHIFPFTREVCTFTDTICWTTI